VKLPACQRQQLPLDDLATLFALIGERLTVVMGVPAAC
jgi:dihydroxyacetone kinase